MDITGMPVVLPRKISTLASGRGVRPGGVVVGRVFINYRGEDSHSYGALLYTELARRFGAENVFLDAESIPAGTDFVGELLGRVRSAKVMLAVIGPRWLTIADPFGRRRLEDPGDWIRRELAEAFAAGVRVIPVLTDHAELPREGELPAEIAALSRCQHRYLRRREPTADLDHIVADLTRLIPEATEKPPQQAPVFNQRVERGGTGVQASQANITINHGDTGGRA